MVTKVHIVDDEIDDEPAKVMVRWLITNPAGASTVEVTYNEYLVEKDMLEQIPDDARDSEGMIVIEQLLEYSEDLANEFSKSMEVM